MYNLTSYNQKWGIGSLILLRESPRRIEINIVFVDVHVIVQARMTLVSTRWTDNNDDDIVVNRQACDNGQAEG